MDGLAALTFADEWLSVESAPFYARILQVPDSHIQLNSCFVLSFESYNVRDLISGSVINANQG
jgi:hypothetical protein